MILCANGLLLPTSIQRKNRGNSSGFNANLEDAKRETSLGLSKKGPGFSKVKVTNRIKLAKGVRS